MKAKELLKKLVPLLLFLAAVIVLALTKIGCPIRFLTGVSCPGCGMTRAWAHALTGHFSDAFLTHPLFLLAVPAFLLFLFSGRLPKKAVRTAAVLMIVLLLSVWLFRMIRGSDVVMFRPSEGFFVRAFRALFGPVSELSRPFFESV